jgi:hypothetical protein
MHIALAVKRYSYLVLLGILAMPPLSSEAQAAKPDADTTSAGVDDPFGGEDPFALIENRQEAAQPESAMPQDGGRKSQKRAELFLKGFYSSINNASRINPGNRFQHLEPSTGMVEARVTYSGYLNQQETLRWLFKGYGAGSSYQGAQTSLQGGGDVPIRSKARIDEIFADWKGDRMFASLGKRRITWGHAQGFNPVNVVAPPRDPLNPEYQTEGQPLIWLSDSGTLGNIDLVLTRNYDENWNADQNRWGLRWGGASQKIDYAVYYFDGGAYRDGRAFERMVGGSFTADVIPGMTVYGEAANFLKNARNYYSANFAVRQKGGRYTQGVIGSSLDLGNKSSLFVELLYNSQGYTQEERRNYLQAADMRLFNGYDPALAGDFVPLSMNRNYLLANYKKEFRERYNFNLSTLRARDGSSSTRAAVYYALSDYYELRTSYLYYGGSKDSEFGNNPYRGLFEIGLKASF